MVSGLGSWVYILKSDFSFVQRSLGSESKRRRETQCSLLKPLEVPEGTFQISSSACSIICTEGGHVPPENSGGTVTTAPELVLYSPFSSLEWAGVWALEGAPSSSVLLCLRERGERQKVTSPSRERERERCRHTLGELVWNPVSSSGRQQRE